MNEMMMEPAGMLFLREQLQRLCSRVITEEDLLTIKNLIDNFLHKKDYRNEDEMPEEFGCTRYDFDEWLHDPGK
ncbi:MAG TPA: hypothetical protein VHB48_05895 [Chitinophagaceae bacterium]|nr:hypothetical protein [Chitinophagaceae bacterium]